jgi:hypothetical protein
MATTLSYGYINPQNGDPGSTWFPALNSNITQLNNHTHDGVTSALLAATSITSGSASIPSGSWSLVEAGKYEQTVNSPAGFNMTQYSITFYLSTGEIVVPSIQQLSSTSFKVFSPLNSISYTAVFR